MGRTTIKDLEAGQVALAKQLGQVTEALSALASGQATAEPTEPSAKATKKATKKQAKQVTRNLDSLDVELDGHKFQVRPVSLTYERDGKATQSQFSEARLYTIMTTKSGDERPRSSSLTREQIEAIASDPDPVLDAMRTVEERAKIGAFAPSESS